MGAEVDAEACSPAGASTMLVRLVQFRLHALLACREVQTSLVHALRTPPDHGNLGVAPPACDMALITF